MPLWTIISYLIIAITILNRASVVRYMYTVSDFGERVKDKRGQVFFLQLEPSLTISELDRDRLSMIE